MSKTTWYVAFFLSFIVNCFAFGISTSLAVSGVIPIYLAVLVIAIFGGISGFIYYSKPLPKSQEVDAIAENEAERQGAPDKPEEVMAPIRASDEEWDILSQYDVEVRAAVKVVRPHGETAVEELRKAHRAINDKSQLSRIASEIDQKYSALATEKRALKAERKKEAKRKEHEANRRYGRYPPEAKTDDEPEEVSGVEGCVIAIIGLVIAFGVIGMLGVLLSR